MKKNYEKPFFETLPLNAADDCILASTIDGDVVVPVPGGWTANGQSSDDTSE